MKHLYLRSAGTKTVPSSLRCWDIPKSEQQQREQGFGTTPLYQVKKAHIHLVEEVLVGRGPLGSVQDTWRGALPTWLMGKSYRGYVKQIFLVSNCTHFCFIFATVPCRVKLCILAVSKKRWVDFMIFTDMKDLLFGKVISMIKWNLIK